MTTDRQTEIRAAQTAEDFEAFARLVTLYVDWCRERYKDMPWLVDMAFGHQALDKELENLSEKFTPPNGKVLLAVDGDSAVGGVAYRAWPDNICEMKRLFVAKEAAGRGLGRTLCQALIDTARKDGFHIMRLDTSRDMVEAIGLYRSFGFEDRAPYIEYPERLKPMILFMELPLGRN